MKVGRIAFVATPNDGTLLAHPDGQGARATEDSGKEALSEEYTGEEDVYEEDCREGGAGREGPRTEAQICSAVKLPMAVQCSAVLRRFELLPQRRP